MEDRFLLVSDVDGTLLGDDKSLGEFARWYAHRRHWLRLVYNSGRFCSSIVRSVESTLLPQPDAIIGGVGTEICCFRTGRPIGTWPEGCHGWQPERIVSVLAQYSELELQPAEFLSHYKISYYAEDATPDLIDEVRGRLSATDCDVELVYSSNRDLDLLPNGVNKGTAAAFLASQWSISQDRVFVSGDTGNDLAMFDHGFRGIVVAEAHEELKRLDALSVYQSGRAHAAGVMDGITHWLDSASSVKDTLIGAKGAVP